MPIDDLQFDALKKQFESEDLSVSPVAKAALGVVSLIPLPPPFDKVLAKLKGHLAADSLERIYLLFEALTNDVRKHDNEIRQMSDEGALRGLVLDAVCKAANTRVKERVKRIGLILANATIEAEPTDADETEEMMRIAMELSDGDIRLLQELIRIEGSLLQTRDHIPRYDAYNIWVQGSWGNRIDPEADSVFSKLESYGLVSRLAPPNNLNILAGYQNRYVLLVKGVRFVTLISEAAVTTARFGCCNDCIVLSTESADLPHPILAQAARMFP